MNTRIPEGTSLATLQAQVETLLHVAQTGHFPDHHTTSEPVTKDGGTWTEMFGYPGGLCTDDRCPANTWANPFPQRWVGSEDSAWSHNRAVFAVNDPEFFERQNRYLEIRDRNTPSFADLTDDEADR